MNNSKKRTRKELPVSTKGLIRTYSYYSYTLAILDNDAHTGSLAANIDIEDYGDYEWKSIVEELEIKRDKENFSFFANEFNTNMNACIYRAAKIDDEILIRIHHQQYSHPWSAINLFLSHQGEECMLIESTYTCRLGNFMKDGIYYMIHDGWVTIDKPTPSNPIELVLRKKGKTISAFCTDSSGKSCLLHSETIDDLEDGDLKIGVELKLLDNAYYDWLFCNFIQLDANVSNPHNKLRYFYGLERNWTYYNVHNFLKYREISWDEAGKNPKERLSFVKDCIDRNCYIEFFANQIFIPNRREYRNQHHFHQNLAYGYDDSSKCILLLGYNDNGIPELTHMSYKDFCKFESFTPIHNNLYLVEYDQNGSIYECSIPYVSEMIRQYLNGFDSSFYVRFLLQKPERVYGLNIYDEWIQNDEWMSCLLTDKRILHLLHEHKVCMSERIHYLHFKGFISDAEYGSLKPQMDDIIHLTEVLRNMTVKCIISGAELDTVKLRKSISNLKEKEKHCYEELLTSLESL